MEDDGDIPANWRDDPLENTPPVRGAFKSRRVMTPEEFERFMARPQRNRKE